MVDTEENEDTKAHYKFSFGDFRRIHRIGLIAAKQRAVAKHYSDTEQAADDLLSDFCGD